MDSDLAKIITIWPKLSEGRSHRVAQLSELIDALERLIPLAILNRRDPWIQDLEYCLQFSTHLTEREFTQADLDELSHNVESVFSGGMGSFQDFIPDIELNEFRHWLSATFDAALVLRLRESKNPRLD